MSFWRGRRVFLTGHTGFKGSWLTLLLTNLGAEVTGFALAPETSPSLFELVGAASLARHIEGDIRDPEALSAAVKDARPDVVIHMAAQALVRLSYAHPLMTYATNVMGTAHVLEAVRQVDSVRAVVCVTSDKCYENREWAWGYRETDPMGGFDPYSSSKGCSELVAAAYRRSFFPSGGPRRVGVATARAGNVIGGGDWAEDRLVPDLIRAFSVGDRPVIRFPDSIRPWQHVLEPLRGYLILAERLYRGDAGIADGWNFGPDDNDARPVRWIADRLASLWGDGAGWNATNEPQPHEATYLKLDCSRAHAVLGWRPVWSLEETMERIVAWHRTFLSQGDMQAFTLRQINEFADCAANTGRSGQDVAGALPARAV
jgi:CDP-glucose 4,6-dehydratase